jgi:ABC-type uncharacterized transport system ATPase subunit
MKKMRKPQQQKKLKWWLIDLNDKEKEKEKEKKTRAKGRRKINCIDSIVVLHQPTMTYVCIGSRM